MPSPALPRFVILYESGLSEILEARDLAHATQRGELKAKCFTDPVVSVQAWRGDETQEVA